MRIIEDVRSTGEIFPDLVLTIGSFDGVHLGHQRILNELIGAARARKGTAALMTLRPHPRQFFSPGAAPNLLTAPSKQETLLAEAGLDVLYVLPFHADVASMDAGAFVEEIVVRRCRAKQLIVGHDFSFGKDARGNYEYLAAVAPAFGFEVTEAPALVRQGERVSSTLIRECILQGELTRAENFLGRKYSIVGEVAAGRGIGVKLGFPTANLEPRHNAVPAHGVYVAQVLLEGRRYPAAVNIGIAPSIRHEDILIEAHLLDFDRPIVGRSIEIFFEKRLRPEKKFDSLDHLIAAIAEDVRAVRAHFGRKP